MAKPSQKYSLYRMRVEYGAAMVLLTLFRLLPWRLSLALSHGLAGLLFYLVPERRRITQDNLHQALGEERSAEEIVRLAKASYRSLAQSIVEFSKLNVLSREEIVSRVKIEGAEHVREAIAQGHGVIYLSSHLGNWEWMNAAHAAFGFPTYAVARPLDNPYLDRFVNRLRIRFGSHVISSKSPGVIREILKALHRGEGVGFLMDQSVVGDRGVFVDFFGKPAYTHKVVALMAQRTGAPVIPMFMTRREEGRHRLVYEKPLELMTTGNRDQDVLANTQRMTKTIEDWVRAHPEQWLWMHDRWKKQPKPHRGGTDFKSVPTEGAVFLDRDGTITEEVGYVDDLMKFRLMEHSAEAIRLLNAQGLKVIVVTNQSGVARGFFPESHVHAVHQRLGELLSAEGARLDGIYYCPHHPTEGQGAYTHPCDCRKPEPGLLYEAGKEHGVQLSRSFVVGDKLSDMALAHRVGSKGVLVLTGYGREELKGVHGSQFTAMNHEPRTMNEETPDFVAEDLLKAAHWIVSQLGSGEWGVGSGK